jgi:epoxyqueuosine reductase
MPKSLINAQTQGERAIHIIEKTKAFGASLAGIVDINSVLWSPSHRNYKKRRSIRGTSFLVIALAHPGTEPALDWWDGKEGGSPGNRRLIGIAAHLVEWLQGELDIKVQLLPYHVARGGVFLKDAAVLAGLGVVGANNLLTTLEYGSRIRLRALCLDTELEPTGPIDFSPCDSCDIPCRAACPQKAFAKGSYIKDLCMRQMRMDEANRVILEKEVEEDSQRACVKYCRICELACPVGQES